MPLSGKAWQEVRREVIERCGNRCERCRRENHPRLLVTPGGFWFDPLACIWMNRDGKPEAPGALLKTQRKHIKSVLGVAHLNHDQSDNSGENLSLLCATCHLRWDTKQHVQNARRTRAEKTGQLWLSKELAARMPATR